MKYLALIATLALASSAFAGPVTYSAKAPKNPLPPPPPAGCECFGPGFAIGGFIGGFLPESDEDDALGGGVLGEYFFNQYIGIQGSYGIYATDSEHHQFDGSLILRYPITSICVAPYVMVGGGFSTNSDNEGDFHVGGGIEARIESLNCLGIFADGAYHFADDDDQDFTIVRLGVKLPF